MKNPQFANMPALSKEEQAIIHSIATTMGELTSQAFTAWLAGMISLLKANGLQSFAMPALLDQVDEFLTASDMAKILKISKALAYRMIQTKTIPSFSIGRTVRVRRADLADFIEIHTA